MKTFLWVRQGPLAAIFVAAGSVKLLQPGGTRRGIPVTTAASTVPYWVTVLAIDVTADSELLRRLRSATTPMWARLLAANFDAWFRHHSTKGNRRGSWMYDLLTLSAELGLGFVTFTRERIRIARDGRIYRDRDGRAMEVACAVDYEGFVEWTQEGVCA
ncbi:hypothetical protein OG563_33725 [Nocardia vinacea]|uniref:Uncharacterized protein n=1 Tax=Nocardia vinacea TaxID=96468 RepID=A0ABZ1YQE9_9NOCA|nr:hypothetical protein [Nocardia vinacea]